MEEGGWEDEGGEGEGEGEEVEEEDGGREEVDRLLFSWRSWEEKTAEEAGGCWNRVEGVE